MRVYKRKRVGTKGTLRTQIGPLDRDEHSSTLYVRLNLLQTWPPVRTEVLLCFILCCLCMCYWDMPSPCRNSINVWETKQTFTTREGKRDLLHCEATYCTIVQSAKVFAPSFLTAVSAVWRQNQTEDEGSERKSISRTLGQRGLWRPYYYGAKCKTDGCFFGTYVCHDIDWERRGGDADGWGKERRGRLAISLRNTPCTWSILLHMFIYGAKTIYVCSLDCGWSGVL